MMPRKILIVGIDPDRLAELEKQAEYWFITAEDFDEALELYDREAFSAILYSYEPGNANCLRFLTDIHVRDPDCVCIALVRSTTTDGFIQAVNAGSRFVLPSGATVREILMIVYRAALETSRIKGGQTNRDSRKLEEVNRGVRRLLHDLNNAMTTITLCSEWSLDESVEEDPHYENLKKISQAAAEAESISVKLRSVTEGKRGADVGTAGSFDTGPESGAGAYRAPCQK